MRKPCDRSPALYAGSQRSPRPFHACSTPAAIPAFTISGGLSRSIIQRTGSRHVSAGAGVPAYPRVGGGYRAHYTAAGARPRRTRFDRLRTGRHDGSHLGPALSSCNGLGRLPARTSTPPARPARPQCGRLVPAVSFASLRGAKTDGSGHRSVLGGRLRAQTRPVHLWLAGTFHAHWLGSGLDPPHPGLGQPSPCQRLDPAPNPVTIGGQHRTRFRSCGTLTPLPDLCSHGFLIEIDWQG